MLLAASLFLASLSGCTKQAITEMVLKPRPDDAGAATPEELAKLYEEVHQQKDVRRYAERLDEHLVTLRNWVPMRGDTKEELETLFDFELDKVKLETLPPNSPPEDTVVWYFSRNAEGAPTCALSIVGLPAVGKLILVGRWPGGKRLELDPGLVVVKAPTEGGVRYFVDRNDRILRLPGALLIQARAELSNGSDYFRAMPLGIDFQTAFRLPGTRKNSRCTKTWEEAVRDLEETRQRFADK